MNQFRCKKKPSRLPLLLLGFIILLTTSSLTFAQGYRYKSADSWAFGVMGDTQWTPGLPGAPEDPQGVNPNFVSAGIALKLNDQFISHGVRFVFQLGDLSNWSGDAAMHSRADAAKPLYDAGIGFFPMRGNHETYGDYFGLDPLHNMNIPAFLEAFPQTQGNGNLFGATNFSHPNIDILKGLSYSFDYGAAGNNARFVVIDTEPTSYREQVPVPHEVYGWGWDYLGWVIYTHTEDLVGKITDESGNEADGIIPAGAYFRIDSGGSPSTYFYGYEKDWQIDVWKGPRKSKWTAQEAYYPGQQQDWISERLDLGDENRPTHAFVLTHRGPMNQNHVDSMFGSNPGSKGSTQNVFFKSLQNNGVRYLLAAHDHLHSRSIVASPDSQAFIEQIIAAGASTKFYAPAGLNEFNAGYGDVKQRETPISQEVYNIGYYIYTIDGPRVTVDYYSDAVGNFQSDGDFPYGDASVPGRLYTPQFNFVKKETWGYSLNGKQFVFPQGTSYAGGPYKVGDQTIALPGVKDQFQGTMAEILAGYNGSTSTDYTPYVEEEGVVVSAPRPLTKVVNTGWTEKDVNKKFMSDMLSLWGMADFGTEQTDTYVLSMSYELNDIRHLGKGFAIAALNSKGKWVNAVDLNFGGKKNFVIGPYKKNYKLGTFGFDPCKKTAWAVLNYNADFAVASDVELVPGKLNGVAVLLQTLSSLLMR